MTDVVIVLSPAFLGSLYKVEKVFVCKTKSINFWARWHIWLKPDQIVSKDPALILHCYCEASRNHQQLLFLAITSHWRPTALASVVPQSLAALLSNACPSGEVGVAEIDPHAPMRLQTYLCLIKNLNEMMNIPIWKWLQPQK